MKKLILSLFLSLNFLPLGLCELKHVHMMHVDGVHSKVLKMLIESGQMPHFSYLLSRGKINYEMTTVDKSETMKVIPSYLSSQVDQKVVGWWQFMRGDHFDFMNTWMDPIGVINYNLGLMGPEYPTVMDFLAVNGERSMSGFGLVRRSVEFHDYDRRYIEGINGAFKHEYPQQMAATLSGVIQLYRKGIYEHNHGAGKFPRLMHSLLAATDEFAHLYGVTTNKVEVGKGHFQNYCVKKGDYHGVFDFFIQEKRCLKLPIITTYSKPNKDPTVKNRLMERKVVHPAYALSFIQLDHEVGRLLKFLASQRINPSGRNYITPTENPDYESPHTLLSQTLFIFFSDHGMVDTKGHMEPLPEKREEIEKLVFELERDHSSFPLHFIHQLNNHLGLATKKESEELDRGELIGIDDSLMPLELKYPFKMMRGDLSVQKATVKANKLFDKISTSIKAGISKKYWFLFLLNDLIVHPMVDGKVSPYKEKVIDTLTKVYLKSDEGYQKREREYVKNIFRKHVKIVYGGGARNNAEFFLADESSSWNKRPDFSTIINAFNGQLIKFFKENPAVELIFIRKNNEEFKKGQTLPNNTIILVMDRFSNQGEILVKRNETTKRLLFSYKKLTKMDPLEIFDKGNETNDTLTMNYHEWATYSSKRDLYHHNVVAGIGSYLFSDQDGIGDILVTHSQGYNYGSNSGGHGGVHKEEKKTFMLVSHPMFRGLKLKNRILMTKNKFATSEDYKWVNPSILDIAPTILSYLGYGEEALNHFNGSRAFYLHLQEWHTKQRLTLGRDILRYKKLEKILREKKININPKEFLDDIESLLSFLPSKIPVRDLELRKEIPQMGQILDL